MLTDFIIVSFASFLSWHLIRSMAWFAIPARIAPFINLIVSLLWAIPFPHTWLLGFASTGGVAVINFVTNGEGVEPWSLPAFREWMNKEYKRPSGKKETKKVYFPDL